MTPGQIGYAAYEVFTGGRTWNGRDMPSWNDLPERIKEAWEYQAAEILAHAGARLPPPPPRKRDYEQFRQLVSLERSRLNMLGREFDVADVVDLVKEWLGDK